MGYDLGVWNALCVGFIVVTTLSFIAKAHRLPHEPPEFWRRVARGLFAAWPLAGDRVVLGVLRASIAMVPADVGIVFFALMTGVTGEEPRWLGVVATAMAWLTVAGLVLAVFVGATCRPRFLVPHVLRDKDTALLVIARARRGRA